MPRWAVAMEATIREVVETETVEDAIAMAQAKYEENPAIEITDVVDVDVLLGEDDTSPWDRLEEDEEYW